MALSKFLNPKNDVAFKKIFGTSKNADILLHFLNDMIVFKEKQPITNVTFLSPIQDPEIACKKMSIVDILCKDDYGNSYVVEMQVAKSKGFEQRAQYYAAKVYVSQMGRGNSDYANLKEVIFLAITDFVMFPNKVSYKSNHVTLDIDTYDHDLKAFSFTFLELAKFNKDKHHLDTMIDKWAYYFKYADETSESDIREIFSKDLVIQRAYEELNQFNWNENELLAYEDVIKRDRDNKAIWDNKIEEATAIGMEKGIQQGMQQGMEKGIQQGMQQGIEKGMQQGIHQGIEKGMRQGIAEGNRQIILNMIKRGLTITTISELTGLSLDLINEIAQ